MAIRLSGSMKAQAHTLMRAVAFSPGTSHGKAKEHAKNELKEAGKACTSANIAEKTGVPSDASAARYVSTWVQAGEFAKAEFSIKVISELTGEHVAAYLQSKIDIGQKASSLEAEVSALNKLASTLEKALDGRDFSDIKAGTASMAADIRECPDKALFDRAYSDVQVVVAGLPDDKTGLAGRFLQESGCRIAEACRIDASQMKGLSVDKYTGREIGRVLVTGKGGHQYIVNPSKSTYEAVQREIESSGRFDVKQSDLRQAVEKAAGDEYKNRGCHGMRYNYAQERMHELQSVGISRDEAKAIISEELGHHRPEITETYLAGK